MTDAIKPNLFIVGAAKCGTTSMFEYLAQHPDVFMSDVKEPYFFGSDLEIASYWRVENEAAYLALFADAGEAARIGEGSVWYLYSELAAQEIKSFNPDARIIIMLRNPVDMIYSLHGQFLRSHNESIFDLKEALAAEEDRRRGRRIPTSAHFPKALLYRDVAGFTDQVKRFLDAFGSQSVHVILFDDFVASTPEVYRQTLRFIGVDDSFSPSFDVHNKAKPIRTAPDRRFLKTKPRLKRAIERTLPVSLRRAMGKMVESVFPPIERPGQLSPDLRKELQGYFADEVARLGQLINRDLSHWSNEG